MGGAGTMNYVGEPKINQSEDHGKRHINKYAFIDMIVLAMVYPLMDSCIARRSLSQFPGIKGRPLKPATVALRDRITDPHRAV
jgi:hypothetical protein